MIRGANLLQRLWGKLEVGGTGLRQQQPRRSKRRKWRANFNRWQSIDKIIDAFNINHWIGWMRILNPNVSETEIVIEQYLIHCWVMSECSQRDWCRSLWICSLLYSILSRTSGTIPSRNIRTTCSRNECNFLFFFELAAANNSCGEISHIEFGFFLSHFCYYWRTAITLTEPPPFSIWFRWTITSDYENIWIQRLVENLKLQNCNTSIPNQRWKPEYYIHDARLKTSTEKLSRENIIKDGKIVSLIPVKNYGWTVE